MILFTTVETYDKKLHFLHQSLEISYFWLRIQGSRHFQLAVYTVFHEESESAVRIDQILHPEEKLKKNQPTRVSISYRKNSYYTSPPYVYTHIDFPYNAANNLESAEKHKHQRSFPFLIPEISQRPAGHSVKKQCTYIYI